MKISPRFRLAVAVFICLPVATAIAQESHRKSERELTADARKAVITALIEAIGENYLYPDRAPNIQQLLRDELAAGSYDDCTSHDALAEKLTDQLRESTNDLHFAVRPMQGNSPLFGGARIRSGSGDEQAASEEEAGESEGASRPRRAVRIGSGEQLDPDSPLFKLLHRQFRRNNFSMPKLEILPGNVGYLRLDMMPPLEVARPTLDAAMTFLGNTDALIIDVRDTPGGVGGFIPYLMSHFFAEGGKLLFTREFPALGRADKFFTADEVGGPRRPDIPLFVLTSSATGSAAENLAFTLKYHGRAITVGETTRGGGHSATMVPLAEGFTASIPIADVIHPETGKGFDGVGVPPGIPVAASEALQKAHELALEKLLASADEEDRAFVEQALTELKAQPEWSVAAGGGGELYLDYLGKFGDRTILLEGNKLKYQRKGGPALQLKPLGNDTFRIHLPVSVRTEIALPNVRFERDENDKVVGISLVRDGEVVEHIEKSSAD